MRQKGPRIRAFRNDRGSNRDDLVGGRPESLQPRPVRRSLGDDRNSGKTVESPPVVRSVLRVDVSLSNSRGEGVSHILGNTDGLDDETQLGKRNSDLNDGGKDKKQKSKLQCDGSLELFDEISTGLSQLAYRKQ
ncbi:hypothetical protein QYF36_020038 [Acer negundo]|nr:hypothetical protein QYF36_020038 [Acer negundo]